MHVKKYAHQQIVFIFDLGISATTPCEYIRDEVQVQVDIARRAPGKVVDRTFKTPYPL